MGTPCSPGIVIYLQQYNTFSCSYLKIISSYIQALARLETKIGLEVLLTRFTEMKRVKETLLQPVTNSFVYGVKSLPITFREVV